MIIEEQKEARRVKKAICIFLMMAAACLPGFSCAETDENREEEKYDEEYWNEAYSELREYVRSDFGDICDVEGDTLIIRDGVVTLGSYIFEPTEGLDAFYYWTEEETMEEDPEIAALFEEDRRKTGVIELGGIMGFETGTYVFSGVRWPSSLRILGEDCFHFLRCKEIVLPSFVERIYPGFFYRSSFGTVRIESCLPAVEILKGFDECWIEAYEVPEDHPLYKTVDGVLYTKDGKKLLAYPNARKEEHFDVPAGVESIGGYAFSGVAHENEYLKTVSLPVGLKALEDFAFYGCTHLQAIAVPLTVEQFGKRVFTHCVSLERVSLPEGLTADKNATGSVYYEDDSLFRGDNGDTGFDRGRAEEEKNSIRQFGSAWLADTETVPVYNSSKDGKTVSTLPGGTPVYVRKVKDSRCDIEDVFTEEEIGWVDMDQLQMFNNESLFYYHDYGVRPPKDIRDQAGNATIYVWEYHVFIGSWVWFPYKEILIPLADAELYCLTGYPEGMGIVVCKDPLAKIPLLAAPEGTEITSLHVGTQIRVLEDKDSWVRVTTGFEEGWLKKEQIRIVLPVTDMKEE